MDKFSAEYLYQKYLDLDSQSGEEMQPEQRLQLRQGFYGAMGLLLYMMQGQDSETGQDRIMEVLAKMDKGVSDYFLKRIVEYPNYRFYKYLPKPFRTHYLSG